jgi:S-methylmethionine-dependent homocysteine/selenocysteine methylase
VIERVALPHISGRPFITDGGMETDLIFHGGFDLPQFAAFVLLDDERGSDALRGYYRQYVAIAGEHGVGLILDTPTWRASPDWAAALGYSLEQVAELNRRGVALVQEIADGHEVVVSGCVGPRGDGYSADSTMSASQAEGYHAFQIRTFADARVDMVTALTLTYSDEAVGIVRAAGAAGVPVVISFTVETDGRLPGGQTLGEAIEHVEEETAGGAVYFMINCAHPTHFAATLDDGGSWVQRIRGIRANASAKSHAELDESDELDEGDPPALAESYRELATRMPQLNVLGGCCGTDHRHIRAICETRG